MPNISSRPAVRHVAPPPAPKKEAPSLRLGSSGPAVSTLQQRLNTRGEQLPVSGTFGPRTQEAVRRLQLAQRIQPANGVVGPSTATALAAPVRAQGADSFQAAALKKAPVALSAPPTSHSVRQNLQASFDMVVMGGSNLVSAHGAKSDPNKVASENHVLLNQPGHFSSTTRGEYAASADSLRDLIMSKNSAPDANGNVGWAQTWKGSAVENLNSGPGGTEFSIYPLGKKLPVIGAGPKVNIKLGPPLEGRSADGLREVHIPMTFDGDFTSAKPGEITIRELPSGKRELKFNWPDVLPTGNIPDPGVAAVAHTATLERAFFKNIEAALTR